MPGAYPNDIYGTLQAIYDRLAVGGGGGDATAANQTAEIAALAALLTGIVLAASDNDIGNVKIADESGAKLKYKAQTAPTIVHSCTTSPFKLVSANADRAYVDIANTHATIDLIWGDDDQIDGSATGHFILARTTARILVYTGDIWVRSASGTVVASAVEI